MRGARAGVPRPAHTTSWVSPGHRPRDCELVTLAEQLAVLVAGFGAGVLTSTVGVASLVSFPVLLALGIPPVVANASNAVGLTPAAVSGSWGYREELREQARLAWIII